MIVAPVLAAGGRHDSSLPHAGPVAATDRSGRWVASIAAARDIGGLLLVAFRSFAGTARVRRRARPCTTALRAWRAAAAILPHLRNSACFTRFGARFEKCRMTNMDV
jgi:hypothetical protein